MSQILYISPPSACFSSFAWVCLLAGKVGAGVTVLGSEDPSSSPHYLYAQVEKLLDKYRSWAQGVAVPDCITVLRAEPLAEAVQHYLQQHPIALTVFTPTFSPNLPLFPWLKEHHIPFIHLLPEPLTNLSTDVRERNFADRHAFYQAYHQAQKHLFPPQFLQRLARDPLLFGFLTDHFSQEAAE